MDDDTDERDRKRRKTIMPTLTTAKKILYTLFEGQRTDTIEEPVRDVILQMIEDDDELLELARLQVEKIMKERPDDFYQLYMERHSFLSTLIRKIVESSKDRPLTLRVRITGRRVRHPQGEYVDVIKVSEQHPDQMQGLVIEEHRETIDSFMVIYDGGEWTKVVEASANLLPKADIRVAAEIEAYADVTAIVNGKVQQLHVPLKKYTNSVIPDPKIHFDSHFHEDDGAMTMPDLGSPPTYTLSVHCRFCNWEGIRNSYIVTETNTYYKYCKIQTISMTQKTYSGFEWVPMKHMSDFLIEMMKINMQPAPLRTALM